MISVILPVYNVEKYIGDCIRSLMAQTYRDFEIILVNDGTKDTSRSEAEKILRSGTVAYRIIDTENRGVSAARNTGIENAAGDFFITVDSDDILSPSFLLDLYECSRRHPESDIVICGYEVTDTEKSGVFTVSDAAETVFDKKTVQEIFDKRIIKFLLPAMLVRRDFVIKNGIVFDEDVRYSEDVQYMWRLFAYTDNDIVYIPRKNYNYVLHGNSTMTASGVNKILSGCVGIKRLNNEISSLLTESVRAAFIGKWMFAMLHGAAKILEKKNFLLLYDKSGADKYLKEAAKCAEFKVRAVIFIMFMSKTAGYFVMKNF